MAALRRAIRLPIPPSRVWAWHARPGALERLLPPWRDVRLVHRDPELRNGARVVLDLRAGPLATRWVSVHRDVVPGRGFSDEQVRGPFRRWLHHHRFEQAGEGTTRLEDAIEYELPGGRLARRLTGSAVHGELERAFRWRHERTARDLARHAGTGTGTGLRIAATGASGFVGSALVPFLRAGGHEVHALVRRPPRPGSGEIRWAPREGRIDAGALEGVDAVVHLAGESLAGIRWTEAKKRRIRRSRVEGTDLLARSLAGLARPPRVLVSASAVGYYGDRAGEEVAEGAPAGKGFLAGVCQDWEAATLPAEAAGIRVVHLRIGVVLGAGGGALGAMLAAFRLGLGAVPGNGDAWLSWIALDDLVGIVHRALLDDALSGAVNANAPRPVTQRELAETLGRVLGRPVALRIPEPALRAIGGRAVEETLLASVRARPSRLREIGFPFLTPELEGALRFELGRLEEARRDDAPGGTAGRGSASGGGGGDPSRDRDEPGGASAVR